MADGWPLTREQRTATCGWSDAGLLTRSSGVQKRSTDRRISALRALANSKLPRNLPQRERSNGQADHHRSGAKGGKPSRQSDGANRIHSTRSRPVPEDPGVWRPPDDSQHQQGVRNHSGHLNGIAGTDHSAPTLPRNLPLQPLTFGSACTGVRAQLVSRPYFSS